MKLKECVTQLRQQFPALAKQVDGQPAVYFDGPAGSQVPQRVIDAVARYLSECNANHGGVFATSQESDRWLDEAHRALADFVGSGDPDCIVFGANMTTLTFALSRSLSRTWQPGDEVLVTRLDHDANVTPWVRAAQDAGAKVRYIEFRHADCMLDLDDFQSKLNERTRLVAVGCASNSVGSINPVKELCARSHDVGARVFLDAVHYAPHARIDVEDFGCDFLSCSAYKFFGPHVGVLWGRRALLEGLEAYKVRPAPNELPGKWMTGTQNHEGIAGTLAAVDYLADLGRLVSGNAGLSRRDALRSAYQAIGEYEAELVTLLIRGIAAIPAFRLRGISDVTRNAERLPTISITHESKSPADVAAELGRRGIFVWHGNYYALQLTESLGLEPEGMVRIGLLHYNTAEEVNRLLEALRKIA